TVLWPAWQMTASTSSSSASCGTRGRTITLAGGFGMNSGGAATIACTLMPAKAPTVFSKNGMPRAIVTVPSVTSTRGRRPSRRQGPGRAGPETVHGRGGGLVGATVHHGPQEAKGRRRAGGRAAKSLGRADQHGIGREIGARDGLEPRLGLDVGEPTPNPALNE